MRARWLLLTLLLGPLLAGEDCLNPRAAHEALFAETDFPSAESCAGCHPTQYREWAASPHAYAQLSPVFNAMHARIDTLTGGSNGDFCIRCHTPVGMALEEPLHIANAERAQVSREGVTCVVCHRRKESLGRASGRIPIEAGDIFAPVYGPSGDEELLKVLAEDRFGVSSDPDSDKRDIHQTIVRHEQLQQASFCGSCHDVLHPTGIRLEEAMSEFMNSPAAQRGESCQDCHMGLEPGKKSSYAEGPAAIVGGIPTRTRRHANHRFVGPDYSIVHPGIFPHDPELREFASLTEWIAFDVEAGWGTQDFERGKPTGPFPERWTHAADRYEARELIERNLAVLETVDRERLTLLRNAYQLGRSELSPKDDGSLLLEVEVRNATDGHNAPTGFDAERLVYLQVSLTDATGKRLYVSGDLDPDGDLRDHHSAWVHAGKREADTDLFSLQSHFLIQLLRGGEQEQILSVNRSQSPLPFVRPPARPVVLEGRAAGARKHRQSLPPHGSRTARYRIDKTRLAQASFPLQAEVKLVVGMVPVNLVREIAPAGFDYGLSAREVAERVVDGYQVLETRILTLEEAAP